MPLLGWFVNYVSFVIAKVGVTVSEEENTIAMCNTCSASVQRRQVQIINLFPNSLSVTLSVLAIRGGLKIAILCLLNSFY